MSRRGKCRLRAAALLILAGTLWIATFTAYASDTQDEETQVQAQEEIKETLIQEFDFSEIDENLKQLFPDEKLDFGKTVSELISGDMEFSGALLVQLVSDQIFYEFQYNKSNLVHILLIAIIAAVFSNFSNAFQNKQVSEIGFYVLYLLLLTVCLNSFRVSMTGISDSIESLVTFMQILCPSYFMAVALATGSSTSVIFYNIVLFLIYVVEVVIVNFVLPLINIYIMIQVLNFLSGEDYLSQFSELLQKVVTWILKTLLACVLGISVIQGLLAPAIDSLSRSVFTKTAASLPGIGNAVGGLTDVVLGTAVLIKNGIGMAGVIVCIAICIVPLLQMAVMTLLYKLVAALVQPVSDKRVVGCIGSISEGGELLLRVIFTVGMLFLLTIAIVTASTT